MSWTAFLQIIILLILVVIAISILVDFVGRNRVNKVMAQKTRHDAVYFDEETLQKVYDVLTDCYINGAQPITYEVARDIISEMLSRGLLFRERDTLARQMKRTSKPTHANYRG